MKYALITAASALCLLSGGAFAQTSSTQSNTTTVVPGLGVTSSTSKEVTVDAQGRTVEKEKASNSTIGGSASTSSTTVVNPDGTRSQVMTRERVETTPVTPVPPILSGSTTTRSTTTTTN